MRLSKKRKGKKGKRVGENYIWEPLKSSHSKIHKGLTWEGDGKTSWLRRIRKTLSEQQAP